MSQRARRFYTKKTVKNGFCIFAFW